MPIKERTYPGEFTHIRPSDPTLSTYGFTTEWRMVPYRRPTATPCSRQRALRNLQAAHCRCTLIRARVLALAVEAAPAHRRRRRRRGTGRLLLAGWLLPHAHRHDELGREIEQRLRLDDLGCTWRDLACRDL